MIKKYFFKMLVFIFAMSLFVFLLNCKGNQTEHKESTSVNSESVIITGEKPTVSIEDIQSTWDSISFNVIENDPDNIGEIVQIYINRKNESPIYANSVEQRLFTGLYSDSSYLIYVIYSYNTSEGKIEEAFIKNAKTESIPLPTILWDSNGSDNIEFTVEGESLNAWEIAKVELISQQGDKIVLEDLTKREFLGLKSGEYTLKVVFKGVIEGSNDGKEETVKIEVSTKLNGVDIPDFIVEVPKGKDPVILQLTDPQIIDAAQRRPGREGVSDDYWGTDKLQVRLLDYLEETINATKPDLILITGDLVYGEFDDNGTSLIALIEAMDSFGIPWAPVFGNHDQESTKGADWQCDRLEESKHCLFLQRTLTGNGNYTVGIAQGGVLTRIFFMMDSNGCGAASSQSLANGHTKTSVGFGDDQIEWFESVGEKIKRYSPETKVSFAFHIQIAKFELAYKQYGKVLPINVDTNSNKKASDFGYVGRGMEDPWDSNNLVYEKMLAIGCDSIYVGHEHCNSASIVYEGVRFQFGQKISTYDRCNWLMLDGSILGSYPDPAGQPIMGGTVNILSADGRIKDAYIYYCNDIFQTNR